MVFFWLGFTLHQHCKGYMATFQVSLFLTWNNPKSLPGFEPTEVRGNSLSIYIVICDMFESVQYLDRNLPVIRNQFSYHCVLLAWSSQKRTFLSDVNMGSSGWPWNKCTFIWSAESIKKLFNTEFILVRMCRKLLAYRRNTIESVPGTNKHFGMSVKFLAEGNNGLTVIGFEPMWLAILRLLFRRVNHSSTNTNNDIIDFMNMPRNSILFSFNCF